jgi:hypothetical protein
MNRRGFLQGIFGGVAATGLIVAAKPSEIEAFTGTLTKGAPLVLDRPVDRGLQVVEAGEHLYNARGELVAIITDLNVSREIVDVTSFSDDYQRHWQRPPEIEIRAIGVCSLEAVGGNRMPMLRGVKRR